MPYIRGQIGSTVAKRITAFVIECQKINTNFWDFFVEENNNHRKFNNAIIMNRGGLGDRWREKKLEMDFLWDIESSRIGELSLFGFIKATINKILFSMRTFLQISDLSVIKENYIWGHPTLFPVYCWFHCIVNHVPLKKTGLSL